MANGPTLENSNALPRMLADGKYELLGTLGSGAMGTVYRARHTALSRIVAIKVLADNLSSDVRATERLRREALAASELQHGNSVQVLDFGSDNGSFFIVMEYVEGRTLFDLLVAERALPEMRAVRIMAQALAALQAAHERGIIHRDMKPENILLKQEQDDDGSLTDQVKVCDFGIAKRAVDTDEDGPKLTDIGSVIGTPLYMAPEQARNLPLDPRTDIYACGVILYRALTGKVLFDGGGDDIAVLMAHVLDAPVPPRQHRPDLSPRLEAVVLQALSKDPAARFQSAREMRKALLESVPGLTTSPFLQPPVNLTQGVGQDAQSGPAQTPQSRLSPSSATLDLRPGDSSGGRRLVVILGAAALVAAIVLATVLLRRREEPSTPSASVAVVPPSVPSAAAAPRPDSPAAGALAASAPSLPTPAPSLPPPAPALPPPAPSLPAPAESVDTALRDPDGESLRRDRWGIDVASATLAPTALAPSAVAPAGAIPAARVPEKVPVKPAKPTEVKPAEVKPAEVKPAEVKPAEVKPAEVKPAEVKPAEVKPAEVKPAEVKPAEPVAELRPATFAEAAVSVGKISVVGSLPASEVKRPVDRSAGDFRDCFKSTAGGAGRAGSASVHLTVDEDGLFRDVRVTGSPVAGLDACVRKVLSSLRSRVRPDTGTVEVSFKIAFRAPEDP
ncbi:MAG: protein kinase [Myxococcales bacterium]|nr:protein kinase [Myxococcales bacterium]